MLVQGPCGPPRWSFLLFLTPNSDSPARKTYYKFLVTHNSEGKLKKTEVTAGYTYNSWKKISWGQKIVSSEIKIGCVLRCYVTSETERWRRSRRRGEEFAGTKDAKQVRIEKWRRIDPAGAFRLASVHHDSIENANGGSYFLSFLIPILLRKSFHWIEDLTLFMRSFRFQASQPLCSQNLPHAAYHLYLFLPTIFVLQKNIPI